MAVGRAGRRLTRLSTVRTRLYSPLAIHLLIVLALLAAFVGLASATAPDGALADLDADGAAFFADHATADTDHLFEALSLLGRHGVIALGVGVGVALAWRREWARLAVWGTALGGGHLLNLALKEVYTRTRPEVLGPATTRDYSFPSGHTMAAVIAYGLLAYFALLWVRSPRRRAAILVACGALIALVGLSRMALVEHYPSDVLAALTMGGACFVAAVGVLETCRATENRRGSDPR